MVPEPVAQTVDAVGLKCPLPVLKVRRALGALPSGAVLEVLASDPGAAEDLAALCRLGGHSLLGQSAGAGAGVKRFLIRKGTQGSGP